MQINVDLKGVAPLEARRIIKAIAAFTGIAVDFPISMQERVHEIVHGAVAEQTPVGKAPEPIAHVVSATMMADGNGISVALKPTDTPDAAAIFGAAAPFVPATVDAAALPTAPVVQPASSLPMLPAPQAPVVMPVATTSAATPTPPAVTVDKDGLPWDARIHSSSKALNADGRWRAKKGLNDDAMVATVQAELRALMAIPAAPVAPVVAAPTLDAVAQTPTVDPTTLPEFMTRVTPLMMAGKLTMPQVDAVLQAFGVTGGVTSLMQRPDLIPHVWANLKASYGL
mgnify:CR=1 FL=1